MLCRDRRLHHFGRRIHRGLTGALLAVIGIALTADDALDLPRRPLRRRDS